MIKAEIKSKFHGVINGVSIDSEEVYTSAEYILDALQRELDLDIDKEIIETYSYCLKRSQMKDEYYSLSDIENEILRLIGERDFGGSIENKHMNSFYKLIVNKLTEYEIPVSFSMTGTISVKATSLENAVKYLEQNENGRITLPDDTHHLEGSFGISYDSIEDIEAIQEMIEQ